MDKIKEIIIGTNNPGKSKEISDLLPKKLKKYFPKDFNISSPEETGKSFQENSFIKASYFSKKTNLICLSDDSGLMIDALKGKPGIYSSRWGGVNNDFNLAIKKVFKEMNKIKKNKKNTAQFICCMTLFWPNGKNFFTTGTIKGNISDTKKGKKGFGYDPIFIPKNYNQTFGEMNSELKMSIDHRFEAYKKIKKFFI
tara:strand:- start:271 stop:861 length:591 start_codon:yes stop_codon:yes gene_type:complete